MPFLRVKNWSQYQHYHHRNPPWIKLHYSLLSSRDWVMLSDADRVLAIACMLIASHSGMPNGQFDADPDFFKRVAYLSKRPNFKPLIDMGFLEHASTLQADASDCKHDSTNADTETEKRREETEERERQSREVAGATRTTGTRLPSDWTPNADELTFCMKERSDLDPEVTANRFRDYWVAQPGQKGRKSDWSATWRNWVRNEKKQRLTVEEQNQQTMRAFINNTGSIL